ncbi:hypothetical protein [Actinomadura chokoriensis]|uniref:WD40 repeat domain-containing protein n=1 Tax=Actinomadura chokoriensis TaxID=454156 RepID=A0ABV4QX60_9ACTN
MNGIEERLREAFGAGAETVRPHAGAHAENARRLRRARVRRRIAVPSAVVATAVVATAAAVAAPLALSGPPEDAPDTLGGITGRPPGVPMDASSIVTIPTRLPGGGTFRADAVGADGSVIGRAPDGRVWRAGPGGGTPRRLGGRAAGGLATGRGFGTWIAPGSNRLNCRVPGGLTRGIDDQGAMAERPVLAGGGVVIGSDVMDQPFLATGCGAGKTMENPRGSFGYAKALAYPTLFTVDPTDKANGLREVDVRTSEITKRHPLPGGVRAQKPTGKPSGSMGGLTSVGPDRRPKGVQIPVEGPLSPEPVWQAAATGRYFAWAVDGTVTIFDRKTWTRVLGIHQGRPLTAGQAPAVRLTAGDDVIAYTVAGLATVWDTRSVRLATWRGEVLAAGGWLLWRDGSVYRLGRTR